MQGACSPPWPLFHAGGPGPGAPPGIAGTGQGSPQYICSMWLLDDCWLPLTLWACSSQQTAELSSQQQPAGTPQGGGRPARHSALGTPSFLFLRAVWLRCALYVSYFMFL
jgi:hypothetical protein